MGKNTAKYKVLSEIKVSAATKLLYGYLLDLEETATIMSYRRIAEKLGLSRSTVGRCMKNLRRNGKVRIYSRYTEDGGRLANKYEIN